MSKFQSSSNTKVEVFQITKSIVVTDEKRKLVMDHLKEHTFFKFLTSIESDIIKDCIEDENSTSLMMKNITDEDDDELQLVKFYWSYTGDEFNFKITANNIEVEDDETLDSYYCVDFIDFDIEILDSNLTFNMSYNKDKHPTFIFKIVKKCFGLIFDKLSYYFST